MTRRCYQGQETGRLRARRLVAGAERWCCRGDALAEVDQEPVKGWGPWGTPLPAERPAPRTPCRRVYGPLNLPLAALVSCTWCDKARDEMKAAAKECY